MCTSSWQIARRTTLGANPASRIRSRQFADFFEQRGRYLRPKQRPQPFTEFLKIAAPQGEPDPGIAAERVDEHGPIRPEDVLEQQGSPAGTAVHRIGRGRTGRPLRTRRFHHPVGDLAELENRVDPERKRGAVAPASQARPQKIAGPQTAWSLLP